MQRTTYAVIPLTYVQEHEKLLHGGRNQDSGLLQGQVGQLRKGHERIWGVMERFFILIGKMVTRVYASVKTH